MLQQSPARPTRAITHLLERHALAARRFFASPTTAHQRELVHERDAVRAAIEEGEHPTQEDFFLARRAAAEQRRRDRLYHLCHCWRCSWRRSAVRMYTLGFRDGVLGRVGKRRIDGNLRSFKQHFKAGLADGRRAAEEKLKAYESSLSKKL